MKTCYYKTDILDICDCKHLTVDEIFDAIKKKHPDAGRSSIYRNVECMVSEWDLRKVVWIGNKAYFEKDNWDHIHLIDNVTGEIVDYNWEIKWFDLPKNFKLDKADIKLFWSCS